MGAGGKGGTGANAGVTRLKELLTQYIRHIDEGIELLMQTPAGKKNKAGNFPANSVHGKVMKKLKAFDKRAKGEE